MFQLYLESALGGVYEKPSKQEIIDTEKLFIKGFKNKSSCYT